MKINGAELPDCQAFQKLLRTSWTRPARSLPTCHAKKGALDYVCVHLATSRCATQLSWLSICAGVPPTLVDPVKGTLVTPFSNLQAKQLDRSNPPDLHAKGGPDSDLLSPFRQDTVPVLLHLWTFKGSGKLARNFGRGESLFGWCLSWAAVRIGQGQSRGTVV